jgi:hypothetical protein
MKHVILDHSWKFSTEPFPAYRLFPPLSAGGKRDDHNGIVYLENGLIPVGTARPDWADAVLPLNQFKLCFKPGVGLNDRVFLQPGQDTSNRILAFLGISGKDGQWCSRHSETDAQILKECNTGKHFIAPYVGIVALFDLGQQVSFFYPGMERIL